jgi:hypothetical protein
MRRRADVLSPYGPRVGLRSPKDNGLATALSRFAAAVFSRPLVHPVVRGDRFRRAAAENEILRKFSPNLQRSVQAPLARGVNTYSGLPPLPLRRSRRNEADPKATRPCVGSGRERRRRDGCRIVRSPRQDRGAYESAHAAAKFPDENSSEGRGRHRQNMF